MWKFSICEKSLMKKCTHVKFQNWNHSSEKFPTEKIRQCTNVHKWNFKIEINHTWENFNCEKTLVYKSTFVKIQNWNYSIEKISTVKNHNCTNVHMWNFTMKINHMKNLTLCNLTNVQKYIGEISQWKIIIWKISHYKKSLVYKSTCVKFHKWNLLKWEISLPSTTVDCSSAEKGKGKMGV